MKAKPSGIYILGGFAHYYWANAVLVMVVLTTIILMRNRNCARKQLQVETGKYCTVLAYHGMTEGVIFLNIFKLPERIL
jgi:hypothetical protein